MKKLSIYLETSVIGFLFADYALEKKLVTERLFWEINKGRFQVFISDLVLKELDVTKNKELKKKLKEKVSGFKILEMTDESKNLALQYTKENIIPKSVINDALHLAIAVVYNLDLIVSWNLKHIVKLKTRLGANAINLRNNYKTIEIATPEEVVEND